MNKVRASPRFSVVMPVYNVERVLDFFHPCVQSVLDQTCPDFELILVDDASADDTPIILEEYRAKDDRVRIHTHTINQKQSQARNSGVNIARGRYIYYCDYDDYLRANALAVLSELLDRYHNPEIIEFAHTNIDCEHSRPSIHQAKCRKTLQPKRWFCQEVMLSQKSALRRFLMGGVPKAPWTRVVSADLARSVPFLPLQPEDLPQLLRLHLQDARLLLVTKNLYLHIRHAKSDGRTYLGRSFFHQAMNTHDYMVREISRVAHLLPFASMYFRTWRLMELVPVLRNLEPNAEDLQLWKKFVGVQALTKRWQLFYLLTSLYRGRLLTRLKHLCSLYKIQRTVRQYESANAGRETSQSVSE